MKKLYALIAVLALLLPVLAGCQSAYLLPPQNNGASVTETAPETTVPVAAPVETAPDPAAQISADEAINIALKDAGLTKNQIRDLDTELDRDDGVLHYDVDFEKDGKDYDYEIDATTGKILKSKKERD